MIKLKGAASINLKIEMEANKNATAQYFMQSMGESEPCQALPALLMPKAALDILSLSQTAAASPLTYSCRAIRHFSRLRRRGSDRCRLLPVFRDSHLILAPGEHGASDHDSSTERPIWIVDRGSAAQPTVKLASKLLDHMRRWKRLDGGNGHIVTFAGQPVGSVRTALKRAVKLAKLDGGVTAYTLRHSCASWLVAKGLPTRKIADFLGTSEAMIERHYGHLAPDYQDEAALAIGRK